MIIHIVIWIAMLFAFSSSDAMEVIKKFKHKKKLDDHRPKIITDLLCIKKALTIKEFPPEIIRLIQQYCFLLPTKNITEQEKKYFLNLWDDFRIPRYFYYCLTEEQTKALLQYFSWRPCCFTYPFEKRVVMHFDIKKENYKTFKTIPIEVRRYLTQFPESMLKEHQKTNTYINEYKILRVTSFDKKGNEIIKGKFIIHEEKIKKIKLDINS